MLIAVFGASCNLLNRLQTGILTILPVSRPLHGTFVGNSLEGTSQQLLQWESSGGSDPAMDHQGLQNLLEPDAGGAVGIAMGDSARTTACAANTASGHCHCGMRPASEQPRRRGCECESRCEKMQESLCAALVEGLKPNRIPTCRHACFSRA